MVKEFNGKVFLFQLENKKKNPFEFSDVQKEIEMNHLSTASVCYVEYLCHH